MNRERLLQLADHIESLEHLDTSRVHYWPVRREEVPPEALLFNMEKWLLYTDCGTIACIAGHTVLLFGPEELAYNPVIELRAAELLDIRAQTAYYLFRGKWTSTPMSEITPAQVAAQLRKMVAGTSHEV